MANKRGAIGIQRAKAAHNRMLGACFSKLLHDEEIGRATIVPNPPTIGRLLSKAEKHELSEQDLVRLTDTPPIVLTVEEALKKYKSTKAKRLASNPFLAYCNPDDILWRIYIGALGAQQSMLRAEFKPLKDRWFSMAMQRKHRPDDVTHEMVTEAGEESDVVSEAIALLRDELILHEEAFLEVRKEQVKREWIALIGWDDTEEEEEEDESNGDDSQQEELVA